MSSTNEQAIEGKKLTAGCLFTQLPLKHSYFVGNKLEEGERKTGSVGDAPSQPLKASAAFQFCISHFSQQESCSSSAAQNHPSQLTPWQTPGCRVPGGSTVFVSGEEGNIWQQMPEAACVSHLPSREPAHGAALFGVDTSTGYKALGQQQDRWPQRPYSLRTGRHKDYRAAFHPSRLSCTPNARKALVRAPLLPPHFYSSIIVSDML